MSSQAKWKLLAMLIVALVIVGAIGWRQFTPKPTLRMQNPEWDIDVKSTGDLVLAKVNTMILIEKSILHVSSRMDFSSKGATPILLFTVRSYNARIVEATPAFVVIGDFYISKYDLTGHFYYMRGGEITGTISPDLSEKYDKQYMQATYSLNLTDLTHRSQKEVLSDLSSSEGIREITAQGKIHLEFVLNSVGENGKNRFSRLTFISSINTTFVFFDVELHNEQSFRVAKVGSSDMTKVAPNHLWYGFFSSAPDIKIVYVEWEEPPSPPFWEMQPYDWILSGIVGAICGILCTEAKRVLSSLLARAKRAV